MRYLLSFEASLEAGSRIDRSAGGADGAIAKILEAIKPETFYVSVFKRQMFCIVNTDDVARLSEAAHVVHLVTGCNLEVIPIMSSEDAMAILPGAVGRAVKTAADLGL